MTNDLITDRIVQAMGSTNTIDTKDISRSGDKVAGKVRFPMVAYDQDGITVNYRSVRPDGSTEGSQFSSSDDRAKQRVAIVEEYKSLQKKHPTRTNKAIAKELSDRVSKLQKCSVRTLQLWVQKFDDGGAEALREKYVRPIGQVLTLSRQTAESAVHICGWWAYRIGNLESIDNKAMATAAGLIDGGYELADVIAVIEHYYGYKTDRKRYPFKPFARWAKYDFQKWLFQAAESNDRLRAIDAASKPGRSQPPDTKMRRRQVNHRPTRRAIRDMADGPPVQTAPPILVAHTQPDSTSSSHGPPDTLDPAKVAQLSRVFRRSGDGVMADAMLDSINTGITPITANQNPQTIAESLATIDPGYRRVILEAATGDAVAFGHAVTTLRVWWPAIPEPIRNNIDFIVDHQVAQNPRQKPTADRKRLSRLLAHIKSNKAGVQKLGVAARLPA